MSERTVFHLSEELLLVALELTFGPEFEALLAHEWVPHKVNALLFDLATLPLLDFPVDVRQPRLTRLFTGLGAHR